MHLQRQATTSDAFSNQPGIPTAIPWHFGLPSPCSEQPVMMKEVVYRCLHQQNPAGRLSLPTLQPMGTWASWLSPMSFPVGGWWQQSPSVVPKPAPLHPTGIFSCRDRWTGNNKKHSGLIHSHWHIRTLNTVRKMAPSRMFSKKPPLKGWTPHHVLVSPLEAHKAVAQLGFPLYEMQRAEVATHFTGML